MQVSWEESYQHCALTLRALADEIRMGLHTPSVHIEGRVIYYNEDRSTGVSHATGITTLCNDVHARNVQAGWWNDLVTGEKLDRNPGELIALCHSELSECLEGVRKNLMDDKLPHRKMEEVEMADCVIRIADYCGGRGLDLGGAIDEKLAYNATRADHKPENRLKDDGKKI
jgi:NTP pyrophosphatase (non-canonical NTP hydrolase)